MSRHEVCPIDSSPTAGAWQEEIVDACRSGTPRRARTGVRERDGLLRRSVFEYAWETLSMGEGIAEIGFFGRLGVSLLGVFLVGGLWSDTAVGVALGVVGLVLLAASTGLVETAMALRYRQVQPPIRR
jgi:hypothetical protein